MRRIFLTGVFGFVVWNTWVHIWFHLGIILGRAILDFCNYSTVMQTHDEHNGSKFFLNIFVLFPKS